jgi:hypothetical protein
MKDSGDYDVQALVESAIDTVEFSNWWLGAVSDSEIIRFKAPKDIGYGMLYFYVSFLVV